MLRAQNDGRINVHYEYGAEKTAFMVGLTPQRKEKKKLKPVQATFETVLVAIGRTGCVKNIGLEKIGVKVNPASKILVNAEDQSSVSNVYAIGDVSEVISGASKGVFRA